MVCVRADTVCYREGLQARQCDVTGVLGAREEVLTVHWDLSRRCAQHAMATVFSSTGEEPAFLLHRWQTPSCHLVVTWR